MSTLNAKRGLLVLCSVAFAACTAAPVDESPSAGEEEATLRAAIDEYFDARFDEGDTRALAERLRASKVTLEQAEQWIRGARASYEEEDPREEVFELELTADHVERDDGGAFSFPLYVYVPSSYTAEQATSLVFVGHGGNSAMTTSRAKEVAEMYIDDYKAGFGKNGGAIVVAPATTVGWLGVGNSILFSTISWASRRYHIDPDRIYCTGQSMGGHLSFRAALTYADRFGAFAPQSGGYDFTSADRGEIAGNLADPAGYATYGTKGEPYGIDADNQILASYTQSKNYDWIFVGKPGGHEIFPDEHPKIMQFFQDHPRALYKPRVHYKTGGAMQFAQEKLDTWRHGYVAKPSTTLRSNTRYWIELSPRDDNGPLTIEGRVDSASNRIELTSDGAEAIRVHLHPAMGLDLNKPIRVTINGQEAWSGVAETSLEHLLQTAHDRDDRGRIFYGAVDVRAQDSRPVPDPVLP